MRKPKLLLHIGTEKTGTTAIQRSLAINRAKLASESIFDPEIFGRFNHRLAEYVFQGITEEIHVEKMYGICNRREDRLKFKADIKTKWPAKLREVDLERWIISSEHFQSRLKTVDEIANLFSFLRKHYDEIKVVIYLRDPAYAAYACLL
jgi:hypothetical protein